jgi:hypothetical protein
MSNVSLRLVHDRAFVDKTDDLAATLLFSMAGLIVQFVVIASSIKSFLA